MTARSALRANIAWVFFGSFIASLEHCLILVGWFFSRPSGGLIIKWSVLQSGAPAPSLQTAGSLAKSTIVVDLPR